MIVKPSTDFYKKKMSNEKYTLHAYCKKCFKVRALRDTNDRYIHRTYQPSPFIIKARHLYQQKQQKIQSLRKQYADAIAFVQTFRDKRLRAEYRKTNREKINAKARVPPHLRAEVKLANPKAMTRHKLNKKAFSSKRKGLKERTPTHWDGWEEMREEILEIYMEATRLSWIFGFLMIGEHTIPLNGENVSGLHVPANLRIMESDMNTAKSNSYTP